MDVLAFLRDLGLERYAKAFADHAVAGQTLPQLTEADLSAIGVKSVQLVVEARTLLFELRSTPRAIDRGLGA